MFRHCEKVDGVADITHAVKPSGNVKVRCHDGVQPIAVDGHRRHLGCAADPHRSHPDGGSNGDDEDEPGERRLDRVPGHEKPPVSLAPFGTIPDAALR
jgi:hypothetical protein